MKLWNGKWNERSTRFWIRWNFQGVPPTSQFRTEKLQQNNRWDFSLIINTESHRTPSFLLYIFIFLSDFFLMKWSWIHESLWFGWCVAFGYFFSLVEYVCPRLYGFSTFSLLYDSMMDMYWYINGVYLNIN